VCFTGGEPLLIKQYYDFMDFLIEKRLHKNIFLEFYTNCSVYNPNFIDRFLQFKNREIVMSIDGVAGTAEYQRHGTKWNVVKNNILKFAQLDATVKFNTAISAYVLLDVAALAKFLMELYSLNPLIKTRCYTVIWPEALRFVNLNQDLRNRAIDQINQAVETLSPASNFDIFSTELRNIKHKLETEPAGNFESFKHYTKTLDNMRDERFDQVFGYQLY
jgi:sulfatase maturation enzyme AslB (radical SAM superfamily)